MSGFYIPSMRSTDTVLYTCSMTLHNTSSGLWHLNNIVRSFRPAEVVHESLDWQPITQYSSVSSLPWVLPAGWTDGWMDGWRRSICPLSVHQGTAECVYTLKTAGQMAQAIKCTDKTETNNRWGEENCERPLGRIRQIWVCDWAEHSGRFWQALFALIQSVMGRSGNVRDFNRQLPTGRVAVALSAVRSQRQKQVTFLKDRRAVGRSDILPGARASLPVPAPLQPVPRIHL